MFIYLLTYLLWSMQMGSWIAQAGPNSLWTNLRMTLNSDPSYLHLLSSVTLGRDLQALSRLTVTWRALQQPEISQKHCKCAPVEQQLHCGWATVKTLKIHPGCSPPPHPEVKDSAWPQTPKLLKTSSSSPPPESCIHPSSSQGKQEVSRLLPSRHRQPLSPKELDNSVPTITGTV